MIRIFCLMPLFFCMVTNAVEAFSGGSGTVENPYQISVTNDIYLLSHSPSAWNSNFILTNDLNMTGISFQPIANSTNKFGGVFDGQGFTISGLVISGSTYANAGFFGALGETGVVKDLSLTGVFSSVTNTSWLNAGIVVGYNAGTVSDCSIDGKIAATAVYAYTGAVVGYNHITGVIINCDVNSSVSSSYCAGGVAGYNAGDIYNCSADTTTIAGTTGTAAYAYAGGITGLSKQLSVIEDCSSEGVISAAISQPTLAATAWAGGIAGFIEADTQVSQCSSTANVSATVTGKSASAYAGGLAGKNDKGVITKSFATGPVSAKTTSSTDPASSYAGGLFGSNYGNTTDCFSMAAVTSNATGGTNSAYAGGISGWQSTSAILNCYSTGTVTSNTASYKGAFAGKLTSGSITACVWDTQTSNITSPAVGNITGGTSSIAGKTTEQMKTISTFTTLGWNFSQSWKMSPSVSDFTGYPVLLWQPDPELDTLQISLVKGWTWVSFNVLPEEPTIANVLAGHTASNNDIIVSGNGTNATYINGNWFGGLTTIQPGLKYSIYSATAATFTVEGYCVNESTQINLVSGWNWLGYCSEQARPLAECLSLLQASNNDLIVSSNGLNATYINGNWFGGLQTLEPGKGYMLCVATPQTFTYALSAANSQFTFTANMIDFSSLASNWLVEDVTNENIIADQDDLAALIDNWLK